MEIELDAVDYKILDLLKKDSRASLADIAKEVGRTEVTVRRRVKRLIQMGIIKQFTIIINPDINKNVRAFIRAKLLMKNSTEIAKKIENLPEVEEAYFLDGQCGIMMRCIVPSLTDLREFLENKIGKIEGLGDIETCVVLDNIKIS